VDRQRTGKRAQHRRPPESNVATIAERLSRLWRRRSSGAGLEPPLVDAGWEQRFEACEARIEHLETALEGVQDALYRHEILDKETIAEFAQADRPRADGA
jgi:hypothetical protein